MTGAGVTGAGVTGLLVGADEGAEDGMDEGADEGADDGKSEGATEGIVVGERVSPGLLGEDDGPVDGVSVGELDTEGVVDPVRVGKIDGRLDGSMVLGVPVGNSVGAAVGKLRLPSWRALTFPSVSLKYSTRSLWLRENSARTLGVHGLESWLQLRLHIVLPSLGLRPETTPSSWMT